MSERPSMRPDGFRAVAHHPVEIRAGDLCIPGSADLVLFGAEGPVLVSDLKVVGDETWRRVQNSPKREHRAQTNLYAWALSSPRWSVCYVRAGTGEILEHFGDADEFEAKRDLGLFKEAAYWVRKNAPPPRPYEDRDGQPCRLCGHRTECWKP